jgi:peptidoglycan/LPS O-acetylase OafA/YrhL
MKQAPIKPLTSLRGIAAWGIVYFHFLNYFPTNMSGSVTSIVISRANVAVDLFFIMSGFVISLNYKTFFDRISLGSLREFSILRLSRVYPLHIFLLLLFLIYALGLCLIGKSPFENPQYNIAYFILSIFMIQNWGFTSDLAWNVPAWSISTEFACYILFPFASNALDRVVRTRAAALLAIFIALGTIAAVFWRSGADSVGEQVPALGLFRCISEFLVGMLIQKFAHLFRSPTPSEQLCVIGMAVAAMAVGYTLNWKDYIFIPGAFTALIYAMLCERGAVSAALSHPWAVFLGDISYSTYLCHYLIKRWVALMVDDPHHIGASPLLVYTAAVVLASVLLYRFVERPSRTFIRAMAREQGHWRLGKAGGANA